MFNNTDRKDGQIEAAEQQVQDVLKTASEEMRGSRKAEREGYWWQVQR